MRGGRRFGFDASNRDSDFTMENQALMRHNEALQSELDAIKKRLDEIETRTANSR
jgi:predicted nuclease with TOPRIM domain